MTGTDRQGYSTDKRTVPDVSILDLLKLILDTRGIGHWATVSQVCKWVTGERQGCLAQVLNTVGCTAFGVTAVLAPVS